MKILIRHEQCASDFIYRGLASAFEDLGHKCFFWNPSKVSIFRAFNDLQPDIFWTQGYNLTRPEIKACNQSSVKVICKVGFNGKFNEDCDRQKYPTGPFWTKEEEEKVLSLKNLKFVWGYGPSHYAKYIIGNWSKYTKIYALLPAADTHQYYQVPFDEKYKSDCFICSGYWPYKAQNYNQYIFPLCYPINKYNIKIGGTGWPLSQNIGNISVEDERKFYSSTTIGLNNHEPHANDFGFECNERTFKLANSKCFIISDYVKGLEEIFGDKIILCKTPQEFHEKVDYYIIHPNERLSYIQKMYEEVSKNHTYKNRVEEILKLI